MRRPILIAAVALMGMLCIIAAPSRGAVIGIANAHATIDIPAGWTYNRNDTSLGSEYDLLIESPASGLYQVVGLFGTQSWSGSVTPEKLYNELKKGISDAGFTGVTYVVAPRNITINGLPACDATITAIESSVAIEERIMVTASDGWNLEYMLAFASVTSIWSTFSSAINSCVMSLTVEPKEPSSFGSMALVIAVIVVVVVVVVVLVLLMRRKKPEPVMIQPPLQPVQPPTPPPST